MLAFDATLSPATCGSFSRVSSGPRLLGIESWLVPGPSWVASKEVDQRAGVAHVPEANPQRGVLPRGAKPQYFLRDPVFQELRWTELGVAVEEFSCPNHL